MGIAALVALFSISSCTIGPYCKEKLTIISSLDEKSPDGISGRQILERAVGSYSVQMEYFDEPGMGWTFVDVHPPARVTDFELKVSYQGGEIRHLGVKVVDPGGGGNSVEPECRYGKTEVDVVVEARSGDGLLNEVLDATLAVSTHAGNPGEHDMSVSLKAPLDPDNMMGTATFEDIRPPQKHMKDLEVGVYGSFGGEEGGMRSCGWGGTILYGGGGTSFRIASCRLQ